LKAMLRVVDTLAQDPEYKFSDWAYFDWSKGSRFKTTRLLFDVVTAGGRFPPPIEEMVTRRLDTFLTGIPR